MKVSRQQAEENRARVVDVAGTQFREHGFDGVGIADLMKAAGLTHGGFYANFASKDDLASEAAGRAIAETTARLKDGVQDAADPLAAVVDAYLSQEHRDALGSGCVLAALAADAARGSEKLRTAFEVGVENYLSLLLPLMPGKTEAERRVEAMSTLATMIGALVLARTVTSPELSQGLLAAAKQDILGKPLARALAV
jgi:TetR/AcrR family transcriptional regulator, transcriptional repressor for nem operon